MTRAIANGRSNSRIFLNTIINIIREFVAEKSQI